MKATSLREGEIMQFPTTQSKKLKEKILEWICPTVNYNPLRTCEIRTPKANAESPVITEEIVREAYTELHYSQPYIPISQRRTVSRLVDYHRMAI
jgi:hypothetical protein